MSDEDQKFERIPNYPPIFARGTVAGDPVVVVGYEAFPDGWGKIERGLVKVRHLGGTVRSVPPADFRKQTLDEREAQDGLGFEWEAFIRSRSEADTIAAARALLAPVAGHPLFDIALELMACPIVAWSKVFPEMPMDWSVSARDEDDEDGRSTIFMQLRLDFVGGTQTGHRALLLVWVEEKTDGWTLAENAPGVKFVPYVGDISTLDRALACLVDGSHV